MRICDDTVTGRKRDRQRRLRSRHKAERKADRETDRVDTQKDRQTDRQTDGEDREGEIETNSNSAQNVQMIRETGTGD